MPTLSEKAPTLNGCPIEFGTVCLVDSRHLYILQGSVEGINIHASLYQTPVRLVHRVKSMPAKMTSKME